MKDDKRVFKVSNIQKTFKSVSGYLLANWSNETLTAKIIQFASANAISRPLNSSETS